MIDDQRIKDFTEQHLGHRRSFLKPYMEWVYGRTDAPLAFGMGGGLSLLSMNAHPDLCMHLGSKIHANLYVMLVGISGWSRKTTALHLVEEIQQRVDSSKIGADPGSPQGLDEQLSVQPQQCIIYEEFGDFLSQSAQPGQFSTMREKYTRLYDCRTTIRQLSQRQVEVTEPRLSILAAVTPSYLEDFTIERDWMGGFFGRICQFVAEPERFTAAPERNLVMQDWLVARLSMMSGYTLYPCAGFTPDALKLWNRWCASFRKKSLEGGVFEQTTSARVPTFAIRFSLVLAFDAIGALGDVALDGTITHDPDIDPKYACIQPPIRPNWRISVPILRGAIALAEMNHDSQRWIVDNLCANRFERERRNILQSMRTRKEDIITLRMILNRLKPKLEKRDVLRILESLIESGTVFQRQNKADSFSFNPPTQKEVDAML
jgi:hypothetical protein